MSGNLSSRSLCKSADLKADPEHFYAEHDYDEHDYGEANELLCETDAATNQINCDLLSLTTIHRKKKIKNRHVKAACMIAVVWTIMVALIVAALSVDWWSNLRRDPSDMCTLCGKGSNFSMEEIELTDWPTRSPSSNTNPSLFTMLENSMPLRPPPNNIQEVCAPSIYLDYGPGYSGPSIDDLVSLCANTCFPGAKAKIIYFTFISDAISIPFYLATCCLANDEEAKLGLITTLESQGLGAQAKNYLESIQNCYVGDNVDTCDEYDRWCATLYRIDFALETVASSEVNVPCTAGVDDAVIESERSFLSDRLQDECSDKCNPLFCCYRDVNNSTGAFIERKRKRQHIPFHSGWQDEDNFRKLASDQICQSFTAHDGSLNAKICKAYAPSCNSNSASHSSILIPTLTRPTSATLNTTSTSGITEFNTSHAPTASPFPTTMPSENLYSSNSSMLQLNSNVSQAPSMAPHASLSHVPSYQYGNESMILTVITISQTPTSGRGANTTMSYSLSHQSSNETSVPSSQHARAASTSYLPSSEPTHLLGNEPLTQIPTT
jgi:hypothetical protein